MKSKIIWTLVVSGLVLHSSRAAESAVTSEALRERYVEGVRVISEVRAAANRANDVLSLVESGADSQARKITEMETRLEGVKNNVTALETQSSRRVVAGQNLLGEKARLEERFAALDLALRDDQALLAGAAKTVDALLMAADKSGRLAERRLADQTADELKLAAEQLHLAIDRLAQMELAVKLEFTLLQGLQAKAANETAGISAVKAEEVKLAHEVAAQRAAVDKLTSDLIKSRERLVTQVSGFSRNVEKFRVAQVAVLRRWLIDGPPAGETPSFTIMDVQEAGFASEPMRPETSSTVLGPTGAGLMAREASVVESNDMIRGQGGPGGDDALNQASAEMVQLNRKARWYLAMLSRLSSFVAQSLNEAGSWRAEAENWAGEFSACNRSLADQHGALATLGMEQDIAQTRVGLISAQAVTVGAQIQSMAADIERQAKKLEGISAELGRQAGT